MKCSLSCSILFSLLLCTACKGPKKSSTEIVSHAPSSVENVIEFGMNFLQQDAKIGNYIIEIFEDSKGNIWIGTIEKGVARYDGNSLKYFTTQDGISGNAVTAVVEDSEGYLWFGTQTGLSKYDGNTFVNFTNEAGDLQNRITDLFIDETGTFWIGSWDGVFKFEEGDFKHFPIPKPEIELYPYQTILNWITEITSDSKGNIWFGRDTYGASMYDGHSFKHFTKEDGLASSSIREIQEDNEGNIWFGSRVTEKDHPDASQRFGDGGLSKLEGEEIIRFPELAGLNRNDVYGIYKDKKGDIWVSTIDQGAYRYDGTSFTNYRFIGTDDGLSKPIQIFLEDSNGNMWMGCSGGLFKMDGPSIINVTKNGPWE